jgi:hypothetical protein
MDLERGFRVKNGRVRVRLGRQGLDNALDLRPRSRPEAVAGD